MDSQQTGRIHIPSYLPTYPTTNNLVLGCCFFVAKIAEKLQNLTAIYTTYMLDVYSLEQYNKLTFSYQQILLIKKIVNISANILQNQLPSKLAVYLFAWQSLVCITCQSSFVFTVPTSNMSNAVHTKSKNIWIYISLWIALVLLLIDGIPRTDAFKVTVSIQNECKKNGECG